MKRILKWVLWIVIAIVIIVVLTIVGLLVFINPNHFKPRIEKEVYVTTGRILKMPGKLSWSVFPHLGLKLGAMSISNPRDYQEPLFAQINSGQLNVAFWPLFTGRVVATKIVLNGLKIHLIQRSDTDNNWTFRPETESQTTTVPSSKVVSQPIPHPVSASTAKQPRARQFLVRNIDVTGADITYHNTETLANYELSQVDFSAKDVQFGKAFPIHVHFDLSSAKPALQSQSVLSAQVLMNSDRVAYRLSNLNLTTTTVFPQTTQHHLTLNTQLTGRAVLDFESRTLSVAPQLIVNKILTAHGQFKMTHLFTKPQYHGHLQINTFNANTLLTTIGIQPPHFPDPTALNQISANVMFNGNQQGIDLNNFTALLGASHVNGALSVSDYDAPHVLAKIDIDQIDLSRYISMFGLEAPTEGFGLNAALWWQGWSRQDIKRSITGKVAITTQAVTLKGIDLGAALGSVQKSFLALAHGSITSAISSIQSQLPSIKNKHVHFNANNGQETPFGQTTVISTIQNGVVTIEPFTLSAPGLVINSHGVVNWPKESVDLNFLAYRPITTIATGSSQNTLPVLKVPYRVYGSFSDLQHGVDWSALQQELQSFGEAVLKNALTQNTSQYLESQVNDLLGQIH